MKTSLYAICGLAIVLGGNGCSIESGGRRSLVTAQYVNPRNFTNFRVQGRTPQSTATVFSQEIALAAYESEAYKKALQALGSGAERDFRIVEGA